jgi:Phage capsid protein
MANPTSYATARQLFTADLAANLFPNTSFIANALNWDQYANNRTVNFSQSGPTPGVIRNRAATSLPAAANRTDVARNYNLSEFQSLPTNIDWTEEQVLPYAKRQDVLRDHLLQVQTEIAQTILFRWAVSGDVGGEVPLIRRTTGAARPATAPGAALNRAAVTYADVVALRTILSLREIPNDGQRVLVVPTAMMEDLLNISQFINTDFRVERPVMSGSVGTVLGFNIFESNVNPVYNNAAQPVKQLYKADDATVLRTTAATDNEAVIAYHPNFVTRAKNPQQLVNIIDQHGRMEFSVTAIADGGPLYNTRLGIAALVQAAA